MVDLVVHSLDDDKAEDIVVIELTGKSSIADCMVVATGRSQRHLAAMADHLQQKLKAAGHGPCRVEGERQSDWVLLDAGDVIVHLFRAETRRFYNLEKMWSMALPEARARATG
ncbi:MAG: ribosome silencing factor [Alphaproteobacteria bacterium]|nr:ribosome silencing factor [Alphaproteobacteria bacterium]